MKKRLLLVIVFAASIIPPVFAADLTDLSSSNDEPVKVGLSTGEIERQSSFSTGRGFRCAKNLEDKNLSTSAKSSSAGSEASIAN